MTAVVYRARAVLRAGWRGALGLALVVGLVGGVVLTLLAGAHRTATAPDRYEAVLGDRYDTGLEQGQGAPLTEEIAALPSVERVEAATFFFGGLLADGAEDPVEGLTFAGSAEALLAQAIDGRLPDPDEPTEFAASRSWMEASGAEIGDHFQLLTISADSAATNGFDADPDGPQFEATLVGVIGGAADLQDDFPVAMFPASILDEGDIGVSASPMMVALADGADLADLRRELDGLPQGADLALAPTDAVPQDFRDAVGTQTVSLVVVTLITGAAGLVLVGQVSVRRARLSDDQRLSLRAVGLTRTELLADSVARVVVPALAGAVLAGVVAYVLSGNFPRGFVAQAEPEPGLLFDPWVHLLGPLLLALGLVVTVVAALVLGNRHHRPRRSAVDRVSSELGEARVAMGLRVAFARHARDAGSVSTPLAGLVVVVTTLVAAGTFGLSFDALLDEPDRWGATYDLATGQGGFEAVPDDVQEAILADPDVVGLSLLGASSVNIGDESLDLTGYEEVEGDFAIEVLDGELPVDDEEIALGRLSAERLGADVGDELTVQGTGDPLTLRVTGLVVVPGAEGTEGIGQSGLVTAATLALVEPESALTASAVSLRDGASPQVVGERLSDQLHIAFGPPGPPTLIANYQRVRAAPWQVAALLAGLVALSLANLVIATLNRRGRDLAVLRSLGADRRWVAGLEHVHALAVGSVVGLLSGVLGVALGRVIFRWRVTEHIGAADVAIVPVLAVVALTLAVVVVADVVGQVTLRWRHTAVARELAAE